MNSKQYNVINRGDETDIFVYGVIGDGWLDEGITAKQFISDFDKIKSNVVNIHINSEGGYIFEAFAMYNRIVQSDKKIIVNIDGLAASSASFLAMAGDEINIASNAFMMIHKPWSFAVGDAVEFRKQADQLDALEGSISNIYADRTKQDLAWVAGAMEEETWLNAEDAVERGFATAIVENKKAAALLRTKDFSRFNCVPESINKIVGSVDKRDLENLLRDAGYSKSNAKAIASGNAVIANDDHRDDENIAEIDGLKRLDKIISLNLGGK